MSSHVDSAAVDVEPVTKKKSACTLLFPDWFGSLSRVLRAGLNAGYAPVRAQLSNLRVTWFFGLFYLLHLFNIFCR